MNITTFNIGLSLLSSKKPSRAEQSAEGRRILSLFEKRPLLENDILKNENGRPYFPGVNADFNISHSQNMVAVSHIPGNGVHTACDIQFVKPRINTIQIAEKYFSDSENEYITNKKRFFEIWTLKECFLKLYGFSVFDMKSAPSFIYEGIFSDRCFSASSFSLSFSLYELGDCNENQYMFAICIEGAGHSDPEIKWFSKSSLPIAKITKIQNHKNKKGEL
jgi:4'-phosphopantetheinyl transferase